MSIVVNQQMEITRKWYQKSTTNETTLNFHSCAPLQHKKNIVEGTIHRLFRYTSNWNIFDEALKTNEGNWNENSTQNPGHQKL